MNEYIQENKRIVFMLIGLFLLLAIVLYFILVRPLMADLSSQERQLISLENEQEVLIHKINNFNDGVKVTNVDQLILENKIPTKRELDEYILHLQQAELITNSKLLDIQFMYDSSLVDIEEEPTEEDETEDTESDEIEEKKEPTIDPVIIKEKPEELQVLTVQVNGASKDFDDFIDFLKVIEEQERISIVSRINFNKPTEDDLLFAEDPFIALSFTAELTTFYYPD